MKKPKASPKTDRKAPPGVTDEWQRWAAIAVLGGTPVANVVETMVEGGVREELAAAVCARAFKDPPPEVARWAIGQLRKLESVLTIRREMEELDPPPLEVDRRRGLSKAKFLHEYYARNRPVVLEDVCDKWPATSLWSPELLAETLGGTEVDVVPGRDADDSEVASPRTRMAFDEYVAKVLATEWANDIYLAADSSLLSSAVADPLWKDFSLDRRYLLPDTERTLTFLWCASAGAVSRLHHDLTNVVSHQVDGWQQYILVSPLETHRLSNSVGVFSDVDPQAPDLSRFPLYEKVRALQVSVGPGEAMFVPVGWWHHVTALETSISVSTSSFVYPNTVTWANPRKIL